MGRRFRAIHSQLLKTELSVEFLGLGFRDPTLLKGGTNHRSFTFPKVHRAIKPLHDVVGQDGFFASDRVWFHRCPAVTVAVSGIVIIALPRE
jgi:hypothetical protein